LGISPHHPISSTPQFFLSLGRKGHLTSIVTQESNNGSKDQYHDEVDGTEDLWAKTPPEDEDELEDKKED